MTAMRSTVSALGSFLCQTPLPRLRLQGARRILHSQLGRMSTSSGAKRLLGKTVLITGASSGIGRSTAFEFARASPQGLKLVLAARRSDTLRAIADEIREEVGEEVQVFPARLDVGNSEEVRKFVPALPTEFRNIDILVNNA